MIYLCLIGGFYLADLNNFAFFRTFLKGSENPGLFFNAHVSPISTVVISGNRLQSSLFPNQRGDICRFCLLYHKEYHSSLDSASI